MTEELKPCPFCGGKAENVSHRSCDCCGKAFTGVVRCTVCPAEVEHLDTSAEADKAWNRRVAVVPAQGATADEVLWGRFVNHYWDSFEGDKQIIFKHIRCVLDYHAENPPVVPAETTATNSDGGSAAGVPAQMQESNDCGLAQDAEKPEDTTQGDRPARPVTCPSECSSPAEKASDDYNQGYNAGVEWATKQYSQPERVELPADGSPPAWCCKGAAPAAACRCAIEEGELVRLRAQVERLTAAVSGLFAGGFIEAGVRESDQWSQELAVRIGHLKSAITSTEKK